MWRLVNASLFAAAIWGAAYMLPSSNPEQQLDAVVAIATEDSATATGYAAAYLPEPPPVIANADSEPPVAAALTVADLSRSQPASPAAGAGPSPGAPVQHTEFVSGQAPPTPAPVTGSTHFVSTAALEGPQADVVLDAAAERDLAQRLQAQLRRVGCYRGALDGDWDKRSQRAMMRFTERINAELPVDQPDYILLMLLETYEDRACGQICGAGRSPDANGRCRSTEILASADIAAITAKVADSMHTNRPGVNVLAQGKRSAAAKAKARQARNTARKKRSQIAARIIRRPGYAFKSARAWSQRIGYGFIGKRLLAVRTRPASSASRSRARGDGMWD